MPAPQPQPPPSDTSIIYISSYHLYNNLWGQSGRPTQGVSQPQFEQYSLNILYCLSRGCQHAITYTDTKKIIKSIILLLRTTRHDNRKESPPQTKTRLTLLCFPFIIIITVLCKAEISTGYGQYDGRCRRVGPARKGKTKTLRPDQSRG
jgi:hypothetical protein